ncbi:hypothetical protein [Mucilaginibacter sp. dw_454]|uniref:hypothetical protein n=1 Tax=Mucilaginibacter sp. dw_454 TaxID=2720079 RepID=UPI001BD66647|nr:hypothetical protein [Mucilaginibacter sp. dw_454]
MEKETEYVEDILHYIALFRGIFINKMSYIERTIELVIADHYCKNGLSVEFVDFIIGEKHVSFDSKKVIFEKILQKHHKDYYEKSKHLLKKIEFFQPHRNKLAHYMACLTDESIEKFKKDKTFGLIQYLELKEPVWYDVDLQTKVSISIDDVFEWCKIPIGNTPS